jgi:hypothetical protein
LPVAQGGTRSGVILPKKREWVWGRKEGGARERSQEREKNRKREREKERGREERYPFKTKNIAVYQLVDATQTMSLK